MLGLIFAVALAAIQPAEPDHCADPRNCRFIEDIKVRVGGQTYTIGAGIDLPFVVDGGITLALGESVVVTVGEDGALSVESRADAEDVADIAQAALVAAAMTASGATEEEAIPLTEGVPVSGAPAGRLRLTFFQLEESDETLLIAENGYGRPLDYQAYMQVPTSENAAYTTVCHLMPSLPSVEHWPHAIILIRLERFTWVPATAGVVCD